MPPTLVAMSGNAGRRGFEHDVGEAFSARWDQQATAARERRASRKRTGEFDVIPQSEALGLCLEDFGVRPGADDDGARCPLPVNGCERLQQHVDALEVAQLADEEKVGGVRCGLVVQEIGGPQSVGDDAGRRAAEADALFIYALGVGAFEDQAVGHAAEKLFEAVIDAAFRRFGIEVQRAAMGRVERARTVGPLL